MRSENITRRLDYLLKSGTYGVTEDAAYLCQNVLDFLFENCPTFPIPKIFPTPDGGLIAELNTLEIWFESHDWLFSAKAGEVKMPETGSLNELLEFVRPLYPVSVAAAE